MEGVALARRHRAGERAAEDDLPGFKLDIVGGKLVRQPRHAVGRMIQHACGDAGFFDHAVAIEQRGDPAQIQLVWFDGTTTEDHPGVGGVVGNGVEHFARTLGFRVDVVAAGVNQFQRRNHIIRGVVDVEQRAVRAAQRFRQHERQLHFNTRDDKTVGGDIAAVMEEHIVKQRAVIRFADLRAGLHRF